MGSLKPLFELTPAVRAFRRARSFVAFAWVFIACEVVGCALCSASYSRIDRFGDFLATAGIMLLLGGALAELLAAGAALFFRHSAARRIGVDRKLAPIGRGAEFLIVLSTIQGLILVFVALVLYSLGHPTPGGSWTPN